jgi:hypothetical protein
LDSLKYVKKVLFRLDRSEERKGYPFTAEHKRHPPQRAQRRGIVRSRRESGTRNDPQMTQISTDRNIDENNLRKSVSSADEFLFSP